MKKKKNSHTSIKNNILFVIKKMKNVRLKIMNQFILIIKNKIS